MSPFSRRQFLHLSAAAAAAAAFGFTACGTGDTAADPGTGPTTTGSG